MLSPFPGIDPYLEGQHFWEDFHPSYLTYCRDALNEIFELDLLLAGRRLPMSLPLPSGDYFAFVSRAQCRLDSEVYAWTIRDRLPSIPIPLLAGTADVTLDLSRVFATTYERGQYARLIDYATTPSVLRKTEDRAWAEKLGRRGRR
jgi:Protein of unknown function (DUF4058)